jgi:hypothetical protein
MIRRISVIGILAWLLVLPAAHAHSGGTNADGCHNNRRTGEYHCHGGRAAPPKRETTTVQPLTGARGSTVSYANCSEARAAGAAPVRRGDPGYGPHLDRDNDGVGCE